MTYKTIYPVNGNLGGIVCKVTHVPFGNKNVRLILSKSGICLRPIQMLYAYHSRNLLTSYRWKKYVSSYRGFYQLSRLFDSVHKQCYIDGLSAKLSTPSMLLSLEGGMSYIDKKT